MPRGLRGKPYDGKERVTIDYVGSPRGLIDNRKAFEVEVQKEGTDSDPSCQHLFKGKSFFSSGFSPSPVLIFKSLFQSTSFSWAVSAVAC